MRKPHGHDAIGGLQPNAAHTGRRAAHRAHVVLLEANGAPVAGDQHEVFGARAQLHPGQLVVVGQANGDEATAPHIAEVVQRRALDCAARRRHDNGSVLLSAGEGQRGGHALPCLGGNDIGDGHAPCGASRLGHLVDFELIGVPLVGEEENVVVGVGHEEALHGVLFARDHAQDALAAAALRAVGRAGDALDVAPAGHRHDDLVGCNQVGIGQRIDRGGDDARAAVVAEARGQILELADDDVVDAPRIGQDPLQVGHTRPHLGQIVFDFLALQGGQARQAHVQNGAPLRLGEGEAVHETPQRDVGRSRAPDQRDHGVDVVDGDGEPLKDVHAAPRGLQVVPRAPRDDVAAVREVVAQHLLERQHARLPIDEGQHVDRDGALHGRVLEESIEHGVHLCVALELDHQAHALPVRLIAQGGNAVDAVLVHELGDALLQQGLVDLVG